MSDRLKALRERRARIIAAQQTSLPRGDEAEAAFRHFLSGGRKVLTADEWRALSADSDVGGGYLVAPEAFTESVLVTIDDESVVRAAGARTIDIPKSDTAGVPAFDGDLSSNGGPKPSPSRPRRLPCQSENCGRTTSPAQRNYPAPWCGDPAEPG